VNLLHSAPETESIPTPLPEAAAGTTVDRFLHTVRRRQARAAVLESVLLASAALGFGLVLAALLARAWPRFLRQARRAEAAMVAELAADPTPYDAWALQWTSTAHGRSTASTS